MCRVTFPNLQLPIICHICNSQCFNLCGLNHHPKCPGLPKNSGFNPTRPFLVNWTGHCCTFGHQKITAAKTRGSVRTSLPRSSILSPKMCLTVSSTPPMCSFYTLEFSPSRMGGVLLTNLTGNLTAGPVLGGSSQLVSG